MTEDNFLTYFKTSNKEGITELTNLLTAHEIEFQLEDASTNFDPSFANNEFSKEYRVKLRNTILTK